MARNTAGGVSGWFSPWISCGRNFHFLYRVLRCVVSGLLRVVGCWGDQHMIRRACYLFLAVVCAAAAATVETVDGQRLAGAVRFEKGGVLISPASSKPALIPFTNLLRVDIAAMALSAPATTAKPGEFPEPWQVRDLQSTVIKGKSGFTNGVFTIEIPAGDLQARVRGSQFICQPMQGDGEVVVRVDGVESENRKKETKVTAGVMMRGAIGPWDYRVLLRVDSMGQPAMRGSTTSSGAGGPTSIRGGSTRTGERMNFPCWLKLTRGGDYFNGYYSQDGQKWTAIRRATERVRYKMPETIEVGIVAESYYAQSIKASFSHAGLGVVTQSPGEIVLARPRVFLRDGTSVSAASLILDDAGAAFEEGGRRWVVPAANLAQVHFRHVPQLHLAQLARPGVLLLKSDFIDGEFKGVERGKLMVSSVIFGLRSYSLADEVAVVVFRGATPAPGLFEVRTRGRGTLTATALAVEADELMATLPLVGVWRVPLAEVMEINQPQRLARAAAVNDPAAR